MGRDGCIFALENIHSLEVLSFKINKMKIIFNIRSLVLAGILSMAVSVMGQSLLPAGPIIVQMEDCNTPNIIKSQETLTAQPDAFFRDSFIILTYRWQGPSSQVMQSQTESTYKATQTADYTLTVTARSRVDSTLIKQFSDQVRVIFEARCCEIKMPNAFTPNGDNTNDIFAPVLPEHCNLEIYELQVFNRWGKKVYDNKLTDTQVSANSTLGWDGKMDGKDAPSDVYVYWLRYTAQSESGENYMPPSIFKGDVTLIR